MSFERWASRTFADAEPTEPGSGWTSGVLPVFLGALCVFGRLEQIIALPRFHHWHHSSQREALNRNFALHFPWIDRMFGTLHLPAREWPQKYGVVGYTLTEGWWPQFLWPFRKPQRTLSHRAP